LGARLARAPGIFQQKNIRVLKTLCVVSQFKVKSSNIQSKTPVEGRFA